MATDTIAILEHGSGGPGLPPLPPNGGRGDNSFRGRPRGVALKTYQLGMWLALGGITMVFISFTSALIVRRGVSLDWRPTTIPPVLWLNTAILVLSSLTIDSARRAKRDGLETSFKMWWWITTALGVAFLSGQVFAWRQMAAAGVYLATNPSSSFLYLLSGAHGFHLLGGVIALGVIALKRSATRIPVESIAIYWHFMDGLWLYVLAVLFYWR
jgi:cytochrome c oxidase subunit 3